MDTKPKPHVFNGGKHSNAKKGNNIDVNNFEF